MSEFGPPRAQEANGAFPEQIEELRARLAEISFDLISWYNKKDYDSVSIQRRRVADFYDQCAQLEKAVDDVALLGGCKLQVMTGDSAIYAWIFRQNAMEFYSSISTELPPKTILDIERSQMWKTGVLSIDHPEPIEYYPRPSQLFVGDIRNGLIPVSILAQTLQEHGQLRLIELEQPQE